MKLPNNCTEIQESNNFPQSMFFFLCFYYNMMKSACDGDIVTLIK